MKKNLKVSILLFSLAGAASGICISELLIMQLNIPAVIKMGLYFGIPIILADIGAIISEGTMPLFIRENDAVMKKCMALSVAISIVGGFGIPMLGQYLYQIKFVRSDINAVIVLDCSASMDEIKQKAAEGVLGIISEMRDTDSAALIEFASGSELAVNTAVLTQENREKFNKVLQAGPTNDIGQLTNFDNAVNLAADTVKNSAGNENIYRNLVFMITDNDGGFISDESAEALKNTGAVYFNLSITNAASSSVKDLAAATGGAVAENCSPDDMREVLRNQIKYYVDNSRLLINRPLTGDMSNMVWYHISLSAGMIFLLGALMCLTYTILINRRDILHLYNLAGGLAGAGFIAVNYLIGMEYLSAVMIVLAICPSVIIYSLQDTDSKNYIGAGSTEILH